MTKNKLIIPEHEKVYHYTTGESHKYLGYYYNLSVNRSSNTPGIYIQGGNMIMECPDPKDIEEKEYIMDMWYKERASEIFVPIVAEAAAKAAPYTNGQVPDLRIYKMLDRWGSCNPKSKILIMNLELIKVPTICTEYIALHECLHYRYPSHDFAFMAALGNTMPNWKKRENLLNDYYPI